MVWMSCKMRGSFSWYQMNLPSRRVLTTPSRRKMPSCCDKVGWVTPVSCSKSPTVRSCWANWHSKSKRSALPSSLSVVTTCVACSRITSKSMAAEGAGASIVGIMAKGKQSKSTYLKAQAK